MFPQQTVFTPFAGLRGAAVPPSAPTSGSPASPVSTGSPVAPTAPSASPGSSKADESPTVVIASVVRPTVRSTAPHDTPTELFRPAATPSDGATHVMQHRRVVSEPPTVALRTEPATSSPRAARSVANGTYVANGQPSANGTDNPSAGDTFGDRWRLIRLLGQGGMGQVWLARDLRLPERQVAVKTMHARLTGEDTYRERFTREQVVMAMTDDCPHVPALLDIGGEHEPVPYYVMQYAHGHTLRALMHLNQDARPFLTPYDTCTLMIELLDGLCGIHRHGVIHRDLKPSNIIITVDGRLIVTDFGIAKLTDDARGGQAADLKRVGVAGQQGQSVVTGQAKHSGSVERSGPTEQITRLGQAVGSADYASPEQRRGQPISQRSDVYSAGAIWFELLTGKPPHGVVRFGGLGGCLVGGSGGGSDSGSSDGLGNGPGGNSVSDPDNGSGGRAGSNAVPGWIRELCMSALHPNPDMRPSAAELLERLRAGCARHPRPTFETPAFAVPQMDPNTQDDDIEAMHLLGNLYFRGCSCLTRNLSAAGHWYSRAAAGGDLKALYNLGGVNRIARHREEAQACFRAVADAPTAIPSLRDLARERLRG